MARNLGEATVCWRGKSAKWTWPNPFWCDLRKLCHCECWAGEITHSLAWAAYRTGAVVMAIARSHKTFFIPPTLITPPATDKGAGGDLMFLADQFDRSIPLGRCNNHGDCPSANKGSPRHILKTFTPFCRVWIGPGSAALSCGTGSPIKSLSIHR